ncbi:MAG: ATP-binding protein [Spirochaetales bacterium]|jgi:predicted AAA+ superfamily ATPase|nr:ATP-binding protein [Spirochaetales bacterium]
MPLTICKTFRILIFMINRAAEKTLRRYSKGFPVICIAGPRQSGKTTLARKAFPEKPYVSLEDPDIAHFVRTDPKGFFAAYPKGLILDEAQYVPEIFLWLKTVVDENPSPGKYIITGSQQFHLLSSISESLAGRAALLTLLPFTVEELKKGGHEFPDPFSLMLQGLYPPLYDREVSPLDWYSQYLSLYVERGSRSLRNIKDLGAFQLFVKMCASRTGQHLNLSAMASDCGITHNTAKAWISVLETSCIIYLLKPYHRNYGKRLVKSPKLHFLDPGLACRLLNIRTRQQLFLHPLRGNLFESFIVSEILKHRLNAGLPPGLYTWRDNTGNEIDALIEDASLTAIEIKSGQTIIPGITGGLKKWLGFAEKTSSIGEPEVKRKNCCLIYSGGASLSQEGIRITSWDRTAAIALPR